MRHFGMLNLMRQAFRTESILAWSRTFQKYTSDSCILILLKGSEITGHFRHVFQAAIWRTHLLLSPLHYDILFLIFYMLIETASTHTLNLFSSSLLMNIVSLCLQNRTGKSWERTFCDQIRHLKCQCRVHSKANWWCLMIQCLGLNHDIQPMYSHCFNLSFHTNAFITMKRKLKMFHFLSLSYRIFLCQCVGLKTILVIIHQCNGWLEKENKAFNRDQK